MKKYENLISKDGKDWCSHKNDELANQELIDIEESVLRQVYKSIGLTKEDGSFPISDIMDESNRIAKLELPLEQKIEKQLELLRKINPNFDKWKLIPVFMEGYKEKLAHYVRLFGQDNQAW